MAPIGRFCVNVLASGQEQVSRRFSSRASDKFEGVGYTISESGNPVSWIDAPVNWWARSDSNRGPRDSLDPAVSDGSGLSLHPCRVRDALACH